MFRNLVLYVRVIFLKLMILIEVEDFHLHFMCCSVFTMHHTYTRGRESRRVRMPSILRVFIHYDLTSSHTIGIVGTGDGQRCSRANRRASTAELRPSGPGSRCPVGDVVGLSETGNAPDGLGRTRISKWRAATIRFSGNGNAW